MSPKAASLPVRVERLERVVEAELLRREKSEQYVKHMLENLRAQMKEGFAEDEVKNGKMDDRIAVSIAAHNSRLTRIEMALATALGGLIVIGWLINHAASSILSLL